MELTVSPEKLHHGASRRAAKKMLQKMLEKFQKSDLYKGSGGPSCSLEKLIHDALSVMIGVAVVMLVQSCVVPHVVFAGVWLEFGSHP